MGIRTCTAACVAALAMACAASANAGVIFSSIPDLSAAPLQDWNAVTPNEVAGSFTLTQAESVAGFNFVTDLGSDPTFQGFDVSADDHGKPGSVYIAAAGTSRNGLSSFVTYNDTRIFNIRISRIILPAGTYWLGVTSPQTGIEGFAGGIGSMIQCGDVCANTGQTMGFNVIGDPAGTAVPEPSTWAVLVLGLFLLGAPLRLRPHPAPTDLGALGR